MKLNHLSSLEDVLIAVSRALQAAGIKAVLTGGSCATLYTNGEYQSEDLDFVLEATPSIEQLHRAMAEAGFFPRANVYEHPRAKFFVEFPAGPLGIGRDLEIEPASRRMGNLAVRILSATDSCRDRLAHYIHWKDRQSFRAAIDIALRNRVSIGKIERWASAEGAADEFQEFKSQLRLARRQRVVR